MELGVIKSVPDPIDLLQPTYPSPSHSLVEYKSYIDSWPDQASSKANKLLKDQDQKIVPWSSPWIQSNIKQAVDSQVTHTDSDSIAQLLNSKKDLEIYSKEWTEVPFSFKRFAEDLSSRNDGSLNRLISTEQTLRSCPVGTIIIQDRCIFPKEPPNCMYEQLLEEHWLEMPEGTQKLLASLCSLSL